MSYGATPLMLPHARGLFDPGKVELSLLRMAQDMLMPERLPERVKK